MGARRTNTTATRAATESQRRPSNMGSPRFAPRSDFPAIERPELARHCLEAPPGSIVLLEAPAGYGKTTLFTQWHAHLQKPTHIAAWMALRAADSEWPVMADSLVAALAHAGLSMTTGQRRTDGPTEKSIPVFVERFAESVRRSDRPTTLLIDDLQLAESAEVTTLLRELFEQLPQNMVVGIASRRTLQFPISRWLLQDRLRRLDKQTLLLSKAETRAIFGGALSPTELQRMHSLTEGWPAAVKVAKLCLDEWRKAACALHTVPKYARLIGEFCTTELLQSVEEDTVSLLLDASAFETIDPDLCDAVRESSESATRLSCLAARETFLDLVSTASNTWKIPNVLRLALLQRAIERNSTRLATIQLRAAQRYEARGNVFEAVLHYVAAGAAPRAALAFEKVSPMALACNEGDERANQILKLIPAQSIAQYPRLALCRAYLDYKEGFLDEAGYAYEMVAARTDNFSVDRDGGTDGSLKAESFAAALVLDLYRMSCCSAVFLQSAEERVAYIVRVAPRMAPFAHVLIGQFYKIRGDFEAARMHFIQAEKFTTREFTPWTDLWLKHHLSALALARGRLMEVKYHLHSALKDWRKNFPAYKAFGASASLILAEVDYESGLLDETERKIADAFHLVENTEGWYEQYATAYELAVMIRVHRGSWYDAETLLVRAAGHKRVNRVLGEFLRLLKLRIAIYRGHLSEHSIAQDLLELHERWADPQCHDTFSARAWDLAGVCLAHAALDNGDLGAAEDILTRLESEARRHGRYRALTKALALQSVVRHQQGDWAGSASRIVEALELSCTQGYCRTLLDERAAIEPILTRVSQGALPAIPPQVVTYAEKLIATLEVRAKPGRAAKLLSDRETEVIHQLNLGHSNKVISRNLALREPTVKFHVKNICRKLAVRKRTAAVAEAKRLGLIT